MYYQAYGVSNPYDLRCRGHVKWPEGVCIALYFDTWRSESTMGLTSPMTPRNDASYHFGSTWAREGKIWSLKFHGYEHAGVNLGDFVSPISIHIPQLLGIQMRYPQVDYHLSPSIASDHGKWSNCWPSLETLPGSQTGIAVQREQRGA